MRNKVIFLPIIFISFLYFYKNFNQSYGVIEMNEIDFPYSGSWMHPDKKTTTFIDSRFFTFLPDGKIFDRGTIHFNQDIPNEIRITSNKTKGKILLSKIDENKLSGQLHAEINKGHVIEIPFNVIKNKEILLPPTPNNIIEAAKNGDSKKISSFLASGSNINESLENGATSLHYAIIYGYTDLVINLIKNGADIEKRTTSNLSSLDFSIRGKNYDIAKLLIEKGFKNDPTSKVFQDTFATYQGSLSDDFVILLLDRGADPKFINEYGMTTLHSLMAPLGEDMVHQERLLITKYIFENSLYGINDQDPHGVTPLFAAARANLLKTTKYLLSKKANLDHKDKQGNNLKVYLEKYGGDQSTMTNEMKEILNI